MTIKKFLAILFLSFILTSSYVFADEMFYGSAEYNVNSARESVVDGIAYRINKDLFKDRIYDFQNQTNLQNIVNGNLELKDRILAFFSDSTYGILYKDDSYYVYYYDSNGYLINVDKKDGLNYPYNFYKYSTTGELVNMGVRVSKRETYIYSPDEKLIAHWIGANAYNEQNKLIMKRRYSE